MRRCDRQCGSKRPATRPLRRQSARSRKSTVPQNAMRRFREFRGKGHSLFGGWTHSAHPSALRHRTGSIDQSSHGAADLLRMQPTPSLRSADLPRRILCDPAPSDSKFSPKPIGNVALGQERGGRWLGFSRPRRQHYCRHRQGAYNNLNGRRGAPVRRKPPLRDRAIRRFSLCYCRQRTH